MAQHRPVFALAANIFAHEKLGEKLFNLIEKLKKTTTKLYYRWCSTGYIATFLLLQFLQTNFIFSYPTLTVYINYTSIDLESQIV